MDYSIFRLSFASTSSRTGGGLVRSKMAACATCKTAELVGVAGKVKKAYSIAAMIASRKGTGYA
jgi:hypothetical protein